MQVPTKEQELEALSQIKSILDSLGEYSYVNIAFDGCVEMAKKNIEYDFLDSLNEKYERATGHIQVLEKSTHDMETELRVLEEKVNTLNYQLDKELEWRLYEDDKRTTQQEYIKLKSKPDTEKLTDEEAVEIVAEEFGFSADKIRILRSCPIYEVNRHHRLRVVKEIDRIPLYNSTDWNYVLFEVCGTIYEMHNGDLSLVRC